MPRNHFPFQIAIAYGPSAFETGPVDILVHFTNQLIIL